MSLSIWRAELTFAWTVDAVDVFFGETIEVLLSFGVHEIVLTVTDPEGAFDEVATTVTLDPAQLSVLEIDEAEVEFDHSPVSVELRGQIGLPLGVDFSELSPQATAALTLANVNILGATAVAFQIEGEHLDEWKFEAPEGSLGITKFRVDWKGARYRFKQHDFPVELKSKLITVSETLLQVKLKSEQIDAPFTVAIDSGALGAAQVSFDADGNVLSSNVFVEVEKPGKKLMLTLPFPLTAITTIALTGGLSASAVVADDLKGSVGRFRLDVKVDSALLPAGVATVPRTLDFTLTIGAQAYPGGAALGPLELKVDADEWVADKEAQDD